MWTECGYCSLEFNDSDGFTCDCDGDTTPLTDKGRQIVSNALRSRMFG